MASARKSSAIPAWPIPSTGEPLPVLGMGTWKIFDVPPGPDRERLAGLLAPFFAAGCKALDTSPIYGRAEAALGDAIAAEALPPPDGEVLRAWLRGI